MAHTCSSCQQRFGDQHLPHCQRQGLVTSASDYSDSNEEGKQEVATKSAQNIPENILAQACQPKPDKTAKPQSNQQIDREVILDGIITAILDERKDQDRTWGGPVNDDNHTGFDWVALITKQLGRAVDEASVGNAPDYVFAMVRVAALAVAAIESVRRQSWARVD